MVSTFPANYLFWVNFSFNKIIIQLMNKKNLHYNSHFALCKSDVLIDVNLNMSYIVPGSSVSAPFELWCACRSSSTSPSSLIVRKVSLGSCIVKAEHSSCCPRYTDIPAQASVDRQINQLYYDVKKNIEFTEFKHFTVSK